MEELTAGQLDILRIFFENEHDNCFGYGFFEAETGRTRDELKTDFKKLREAGYIYYARGLMDEEGQVAGSGYGVEYNKLDEIEKLIPPHKHSWKISGDYLKCQTYACHEVTTLNGLLNDRREELAAATQAAVERGITEVIDTVAMQMGWEESRDHLARKFGLPDKFNHDHCTECQRDSNGN